MYVLCRSWPFGSLTRSTQRNDQAPLLSAASLWGQQRGERKFARRDANSGSRCSKSNAGYGQHLAEDRVEQACFLGTCLQQRTRRHGQNRPRKECYALRCAFASCRRARSSHVAAMVSCGGCKASQSVPITDSAGAADRGTVPRLPLLFSEQSVETDSVSHHLKA